MQLAEQLGRSVRHFRELIYGSLQPINESSACSGLPIRCAMNDDAYIRKMIAEIQRTWPEGEEISPYGDYVLGVLAPHRIIYSGSAIFCGEDLLTFIAKNNNYLLQRDSKSAFWRE